MKRCLQCFEELPPEAFHKDKAKKDGLHTICRDCRKNHDNRKTAPAGWRYCKVCGKLKTDTAFYPAHGEVKRRTCIECSEKAWSKSYQNKSGRVGQGKNLFTALGPSVLRAIRRSSEEGRRKDREANRRYDASDKGKAKRSEWKERNPDYHRIYERNRKTAKQGLPAGFTEEDWKAALDAFGGVCAYCGRKAKPLAQDHFVPLSLGGPFVRGNVVPACKSCNSRKGSKTPDAFLSPEKRAEIEATLRGLA